MLTHNKSIRSGRPLLISLLLGVLTFSVDFVYAQSNSVQDSTSYFTNPVGKGADPWIIKDNNSYYSIFSVNNPKDGNFIAVSKSAALTKIGSRKKVWTPPANAWNSKCLWAPELHRLGDKWYIYYTAGKSGPPYIYQRSGVLESVSSDPQGDYTDKGMLITGDDPQDDSKTIWAIDLTVTEINNELYAVWSGWEKNSDTDKTSQHLYIAKMSNPWTISSERVKISSPVEPWEIGGPLNLNEGPQFLKNNKDVFIIYSARESWTPEYRLGQLKLKQGSNPLLLSSWTKSGPVFQGTDKVLGTGHASFTTSPDDKEHWIFYHSKVGKEPGWNRDLRLQQFFWDKQGNPQFGKPIPAGEKIKKPSGEK
ncbi:glycoside hydrolase family 43 protein [Daejeonella lutea]|uniref:Beta-xylosidase, GH43 family n=1 Tax=Daejeonella lutea TaxID=572036 RepID=A0A1T5ASF9_9SPHI|nr:glycoside hydrolase family 43 protein [Daejeonella lutea]SKB37964.1 Beta-xylosidase, GH43 family [Daejeonella lutea]